MDAAAAAPLPVYTPNIGSKYVPRYIGSLTDTQRLTLRDNLEADDADTIALTEPIVEAMREAEVARAPQAAHRGSFLNLVMTALNSLVENKDRETTSAWINSQKNKGRGTSDAIPSHVKFLFTEEAFNKFVFASEDGFKRRNEKAHLFLLPEYGRAGLAEITKRLNALTAGAANANAAAQNEEQARQPNFEDLGAILPGANSGKKGTLPLAIAAPLVWMMTYDKNGAPLNPLAVTLIAKREVYRRFQLFVLPKDVSDLIVGWSDHASKVANGRFANIIATIRNVESTVEAVWNLSDFSGYTEVIAVLLAFQYCIYKTVDNSDGQPAAIPTASYWRHLAMVDKLARRFKQLLFRNSSSPVDLLTEAPLLETADLHVFRCTDCNNNQGVRTFLAGLPDVTVAAPVEVAGARRERQAGGPPAAGPQQPARDNAAGDNAPKPKHCNYCSVLTAAHNGQNCPWRGKKARAELKKMSKEEKLAGPN